MPKLKSIFLIAIPAILGLTQCKKPDHIGPATQDLFLEENANMKVLFSYAFPADDIVTKYASTKISAQDDGNFSWCFGREQSGTKTLYRFKIDGKTGAELTPDGDLSKFQNSKYYSPDEQGGKITFVEGTGKLYLSTKGLAIGDIPRYENNNLSFNGLPKVEPNGDVIISSNPHPISTTLLDRYAQMWAQYKPVGSGNKEYLTQYASGNNPNSWWHGGIVFPSGNNNISGFAYSHSGAYLVDMTNSLQNTLIYQDSIPFTAPLLIDETFTAHYFTRSAADNSKTVVIAKEYSNTNREIYFSTFIINNLSHKITKVLDKSILTDLDEYGNSWDADLDGNIYYIASSIATGPERQSISKATSSGISILRENFLIKARMFEIAVSKSGKVAVAIKSAEDQNSGQKFHLCTLN